MKNMMVVVAALLAINIFTADTARAQEIPDEPAGGRLCQDAKLFSTKLITDICWGCIFPIRIMGVPLGGGSAPDKASDKVLCLCHDNAGIPEPGMNIGYWEPARLVEIVRMAGCSPTLTGITLPGSNRRFLGTPGQAEYDSSDVGFYHYHYFAFPILFMMDLFAPSGCYSDGGMDLDLMYMSELDPTWNNDNLAFFTNPEAAAVANLAAQTACMADAALTATGHVTDTMWWCVGSWGSMYPMSGKTMNTGFVKMSSLLSARAIGALHRRGMAKRTMGDDAMCRPVMDLMLPKTQYKMSMFHPVAEARSSHVFGETLWNWGLNRLIPVVGEDAVYTVYRWNDCCYKFE